MAQLGINADIRAGSKVKHSADGIPRIGGVFCLTKRGKWCRIPKEES